LLIDRIEAISGIRYEYIDNPFIGNETSGGQPGGNIRNAFLYNPDRVSLVEGSLRTVTDPQDQQTNENNPFFESRLPLAATFTFNGEEVTVISNHFSSKGGSAPLFGQIQPADQLQENPDVNGSVDDRRAQARLVKTFVDDIIAENPDANVVVAGDLNEFEFISPLTTLEQSLTNLTNTLPENERYSYIFQGNSQSLDHILVSNNLADRSEFDAVHVNSEFSDQASDHDPLLTRITLNGNSDDDLLNDRTTRTATTRSSDVATIDRSAETSVAEPVTGITNASTFSARTDLFQPSDAPLTSGLTTLITAGTTSGI
jgi:predicted extracellular nuclease